MKESDMARKTAAPIKHNDTITRTTTLTANAVITYSEKLKEHALTVNGIMIATAHAVGPFWAINLGDSDATSTTKATRKFHSIAKTEIAACETLAALLAN